MRVVIDELLAMAQYYKVDWKGDREYWLLSYVKEAILAPVLHPWQDAEDEAGHPVFLHTRTDLASPQHPLDREFLILIQQARARGPPSGNARATVMLVKDANGKDSAYDFARACFVPESQQEEAFIAPVPAEMLPTYTPEVEAPWLQQAAASAGSVKPVSSCILHSLHPWMEGVPGNPGTGNPADSHVSEHKGLPAQPRATAGLPPKPRKPHSLPPKPVTAPLASATSQEPPAQTNDSNSALSWSLMQQVSNGRQPARARLGPPAGLPVAPREGSCLTFFSWWQEDWESSDLTLRVTSETAGGGLAARHMTLCFDLTAHTFDIRLRAGGRRSDPCCHLRGVAPVLTAGGMPVLPWDLHVGATLAVLGTRVVLRACDVPTGQWLSAAAAKVLQLRERAVLELRKYTDRRLPPALTHTAGGGQGRLAHSYSSAVELQRLGGVHIQAAATQVERLCALLQEFRPDQAEEIGCRLRDLHGKTKSQTCYSRCSIKSAPVPTRGSMCMSMSELTSAKTQRVSIAAMFPAGGVTSQASKARKELDDLLSEAVEAATPNRHLHGTQSRQRSQGSKGSSAALDQSVDFLRATCPGLVPASANQTKRRPATVPKPCRSWLYNEDSAIYIPTQVG
eukprot:jgi/Ulvmu1/11626/UM008_0030.1